MNPQRQQTLVKQAQAGDREALGALWEELSPKLFGYLINTTHNRQLAEDVLQAAWLKAIDALPKFRHRGGGFNGWLFAIARNECRQHWRKSQHETDQPITENDITDDDRSSSDDKLLIEQILNKLSEDDRELLRLRYIADLPLNDIARVLNINFVTVRVRVYRALARARTAIDS